MIYLLALIALTSFGQTQNSFVGTWKVDVTESMKRMNSKAKAKYDSLTESLRTQITEHIKNQKFTFNGDNTVFSYSTSDNQISTRSGTWTMEAATSSLIVNLDGKVERFTYRFINSITVVLNTPDSKLWFNETYLAKN
jgi:hypothetical protein